MRRYAQWAVLLVAASAFATEPLDLVNVFAGTSNSRWMLFPGATLPFGLVKLSPDNQGNVWNGGYEYTVGSISGFSHIHAMALSGLSIMPLTGNIEEKQVYRVYPGPPDGPFGTMWTAGYRSRIRKQDEKGSVGYYGVHLFDCDVEAEVTATTRCGFLRFTFPENQESHLLLDFAFPAEEANEIREVSVVRTGPAELTGHVRQSNTYAPDYTVNFVLQLDKPIGSMDAWRRAAPQPGAYGGEWSTPVTYEKDVATFHGKDRCGIVLNFSTRKDEVVRVRTGVSLVGEAQARTNLEREMKPFGWDFDAVVRHAKAAWAPILDRVEVAGGRAEDREMFYTCLYRAYSAKSVISDSDGSYLDACHKPRTLDNPANAIYSSDGFWGTQWTLAPLWTLVSPKVASSWVKFYLQAFDNGGWIPEAPVDGGYSPIMGAQHHIALIVSAYQKGIRDFDAEKAFRAIKHDLTTPGQPFACGGYVGNRNLRAYQQYGYVPDEAGAASNTMEYAYDDWVASQLALALGKQSDFEFFRKRAQNYRNLLDPETHWARRRHRDGTWVAPFDLFRFGTEGGWNGPGFMEGNSWLYTWFVPQDPAGLVAIMGRDEFNRRLEEGFEKHYVDLSNEPNLLAPFLFNYSGKPWLSQQYSRQVLTELYNTSPLSGWIGEEDEGQLSAVFVLMSMGLFEVDGGCSVRPYYELGSPLFGRVTIHLDPEYYGGKDFTIEARNNSPENVYVQRARLNGKPLERAWIYHSEIVAGGRLELEMGPRPNTEWASRPEDAPPHRP